MFSKAEHNRRSIHRIPLQLPLYVFLNNEPGQQYEAMSVNLHHRGAEIITKAKILKGTSVRMKMQQEATGRMYPITSGEVRWARKIRGKRRYGVSFKEDLRWVFGLNKNTFSDLKTDEDTSIAEFVLNSINDGVFSVNKSRRITSFNRAAEKLTGWQQHEALGRKCQEVFRCRSCDKCILLKSIKQGVSLVNQSTHITDSLGKQILVNINTTPLLCPDGTITGGVQILRDARCGQQEPPVTIQVLGDFYLTMNGCPVYDRLWKGRQSKQLLQAIIALGGTKVSLEKLAFLLWSDSDGDHAMNSLKTALSRLRRVGGAECSVPSNWLAVKHKRVSLVRSICRVDALEFVRNMKRINGSKNAKSIQQVLALYTNDFLPDDDTPWTIFFRDHLRKLFIEGILRLASLRNTEDDVLLAFLEQVNLPDSLHEKVCSSLMEYYINVSLPEKALNIYQQAEKSDSIRSLAVQARKIKPPY